jgi:hypothetical protein
MSTNVLAQLIADALMTNGHGETARRLVLELKTETVVSRGGGWCRAAIVEEVEKVLKAELPQGGFSE